MGQSRVVIYISQSLWGWILSLGMIVGGHNLYDLEGGKGKGVEGDVLMESPVSGLRDWLNGDTIKGTVDLREDQANCLTDRLRFPHLQNEEENSIDLLDFGDN